MKLQNYQTFLSFFLALIPRFKSLPKRKLRGHSYTQFLPTLTLLVKANKKHLEVKPLWPRHSRKLPASSLSPGYICTTSIILRYHDQVFFGNNCIVLVPFAPSWFSHLAISCILFGIPTDLQFSASLPDPRKTPYIDARKQLDSYKTLHTKALPATLII